MAEMWRKAQFRGDQVYARCSADGEWVVVKGFVPFCYKPGGKQYKTNAAKLTAAGPPEALDMPAAKSGKSTKAKGLAASGSPRPDDVAVQLWTDGACTGNPGPAGAGVYMLHRGEEREVSEYLGQGTNNIAELTAILRGLELVEDPTMPVDVMTDSSYCVGLLTKGWKAKANQELVADLRALAAKFTDLRIVKVKGHAGIEGNERADQLAVAAIYAR